MIIYDECKDKGLIISREADENLDILTDYYYESRYPDMLGQDLNNKKVAKEALESAKGIVDEVKKQISS